VLNAFRHPRNPHRRPSARCDRTDTCAQRLSASKESAPWSDPTLCVQRLVLNAFRHPRNPHTGCSWANGPRGGVLNAFRHPRNPHPANRRRIRPAPWCAQRLSASKESARRAAHVPASNVACSTPFGIQGIRTWMIGGSMNWSTSAQRLSASKESAQRSALSRAAAISGAQRLSASKESAHNVVILIGPALLGAQRLSASKESALVVCDTDADAIGRCSTPFGIQGIRTDQRALAVIGPQVLNAFRHPRNPHVQAGYNRQPQDQCSTPFGIQGIRTPARAALDRVGQVLNAFRHPRNPHLADHGRALLGEDVLNAFRHPRNPHKGASDTLAITWKCSTPFGIQGIRTAVSRKTGERCPQCSTPFGIQGIRTIGKRLERASVAVLNAFRHPRNPHHRVPVFPRAAVGCSTPFGIQGIRTIVQGRILFGVALCSTPFGIQGIRTCSLWPLSLSPWRAQRLSASKESAPTTTMSSSPRRGCSTPFGIQGIRTAPVRTWRGRGTCAERFQAYPVAACGNSGAAILDDAR